MNNGAGGCTVENGLTRCRVHALLLRLYGVRGLRRLCLSLAKRWEGGNFRSATLREILWRYHGVRVGAYSYGPCLIPGAVSRGVTVGRYVSVAVGVRFMLRNHPLEHLSTHPFFFNRECGVVCEDVSPLGTLVIGHDAWIGANALVTPGCRRIGIGAVVAAGAVVTHDVPDFAVVAGVPAKVIRYRFAEEVRERVLASRWWERSIEECARHIEDFLVPLTDGEACELLKVNSGDCS